MIITLAFGRVSADAKVFQYGGNKSGVSFGLICNRFYNDPNPTYIKCTIFNADERIAKYITVGKQLNVSGTLTRNKEGYYSIDVKDWEFGASPSHHGEERSYREEPNDGRSYREELNDGRGSGNNHAEYDHPMDGYNVEQEPAF